MTLFHSITTYVQSILDLLTLNLFMNHFFSCKPKKKQIPIQAFFVIVWACLTLPPSISYNYTVTLTIHLIYTLLIVKGSLRTRLFCFVKYELLYLFASTVVTVLHTLLTMDIAIYASNNIYAEYTNILCFFYLYILLSMYIIRKKLSEFPTGKMYRRYFMAVTGITVVLLILCSMILGNTIIKEEYIVPLIFSLLLIMSFLCISIYHKVITVLEDNARTKVESEKYALQLDYQEHIEENIKSLSTLRHDFKNHLIIISEYARSGNHDKLQSYIASIQQELAPTKLITTSSDVISSLMNAKNETCKRKNITLTFHHNFEKVNIDDFYMVTILSNLMDNAITAAGKCQQGYINMSMSEINSYLEIDCLNNHQEKIVVKNNRFKTTKTELAELHGMGIISIRKAVEKLHGEIQINYTDNTFHVNILIPNY